MAPCIIMPCITGCSELYALIIMPLMPLMPLMYAFDHHHALHHRLQLYAFGRN